MRPRRLWQSAGIRTSGARHQTTTGIQPEKSTNPEWHRDCVWWERRLRQSTWILLRSKKDFWKGNRHFKSGNGDQQHRHCAKGAERVQKSGWHLSWSPCHLFKIESQIWNSSLPLVRYFLIWMCMTVRWFTLWRRQKNLKRLTINNSWQLRFAIPEWHIINSASKGKRCKH